MYFLHNNKMNKVPHWNQPNTCTAALSVSPPEPRCYFARRESLLLPAFLRLFSRSGERAEPIN